MNSAKSKAQNIDEFISQFPKDIRQKLETVRETIRKAAPMATEKISYGIPAFDQNGILVYFSAYKHHIGFYPTGSGIEQFKCQLSRFKFSKGAIQFPLDRPIPMALITRIVKFRVKKNLEMNQKKGNKR